MTNYEWTNSSKREVYEKIVRLKMKDFEKKSHEFNRPQFEDS